MPINMLLKMVIMVSSLDMDTMNHRMGHLKTPIKHHRSKMDSSHLLEVRLQLQDQDCRVARRVDFQMALPHRMVDFLVQMVLRHRMLHLVLIQHLFVQV
jgi:hypothetical protein